MGVREGTFNESRRWPVYWFLETGIYGAADIYGGGGVFVREAFIKNIWALGGNITCGPFKVRSSAVFLISGSKRILCISVDKQIEWNDNSDNSIAESLLTHNNYTSALEA